ncbi:TPA: hypothetical protein ACSTNG_001811 [Serratia fonticola]
MTLKQEDSELDELFRKALGMKRSAMIRRITQIKLMAWEQVLLIAMYARSQYKSDQRSFHARMRLVALLDDPAFKTLQPHLLPLIDDGKGSFSIIGLLKEDFQSWGVEKHLYDCFIKTIEDDGFIFGTRPFPYLYSHHDLYIALTRFISICQAMLGLGPSQKICDDLTEAKLRQVFAHKIQSFNMIFGVGNLGNLEILGGLENQESQENQENQENQEGQGSLNEPITLKTLLGWQLEEKKDVKSLAIFIESSMARDMQNILDNHFNVQSSDVRNQHNSCFDEEKKIKIPDWVQQDVDSEKNQYNLRLDITTLNRFMLMGQHKEIRKKLEDMLHVAVSGQLTLPQSQAPNNDNVSAAEWQHACTVLGLSRLDEVPPRIAAILYFDLQFMHIKLYSACREINVSIDQPLKREQVEMITTYIIRHCLFNQGLPSDFEVIESRKLVVDKFSVIAKASSNALADPMMEIWANDTASKVRPRFKKPLREFKTELEEIEKLVRDQMRRAMVNPYPIQAGFPAPLWLPQNGRNLDAGTTQEINES